LGNKNDVKNNMNSENESEYIKVFNKLHEKKLISLKNKGVFWCLKTNKEISMD
jgi:isoleucyl-tRNA synthetase